MEIQFTCKVAKKQSNRHFQTLNLKNTWPLPQIHRKNKIMLTDLKKGNCALVTALSENAIARNLSAFLNMKLTN